MCIRDRFCLVQVNSDPVCDHIRAGIPGVVCCGFNSVKRRLVCTEIVVDVAWTRGCAEQFRVVKSLLVGPCAGHLIKSIKYATHAPVCYTTTLI